MSDSPERKWKTIRDLDFEPGSKPDGSKPDGSKPDDSELPALDEPEATEETPEFSGQQADGLDTPVETGPQLVLVAYPSASTNRLLRETLENFTNSKVETTSDPVRAFEMALQKPYRVFLFALEVGELSGPLLYELIFKAHSTGHGPNPIAPGVIFVRESKEEPVSEELRRDARVKDIISKPIRIDRLLRSVKGILEIHDPTASGE